MGLTIGQKSYRVVVFLQGLQRRRVAKAMAKHGFKKKDLVEGWRLLQNISSGRLGQQDQFSAEQRTMPRVDAWENYWYSIIQAVLERHTPDVAAKVFLNLAKSSGPQVAIGVQTLVTRLREVQADSSKEAKLAMQMLKARGFGEEQLAEAEELLLALQELPEMGDELQPATAQLQDAEAAMWSWYREWSTIARGVIRDRNLLRALGFLRNGSRSSQQETVGDESDSGDEEEAAPLSLPPASVPA